MLRAGSVLDSPFPLLFFPLLAMAAASASDHYESVSSAAIVGFRPRPTSSVNTWNVLEVTLPDRSTPHMVAKNFRCEERNGLYADPSNCTRFIQCSDLTPFLKTCPRGLMFSQRLNLCDWPQNVAPPCGTGGAPVGGGGGVAGTPTGSEGFNGVRSDPNLSSMWTTAALDFASPSPKQILQMHYEKPLTLGETVTPFAVREAPLRLSWEGIEKDSYYTLIMVDVDAPSRQTRDGDKREVLHWLVANIPGGEALAPHLGKTLAPYIGPGPPDGTGKHRYVFLIFDEGKTPKDFGRARSFSRDEIMKRITWNFDDQTANWNVIKFAEWANLTTSSATPAAGTFFEAAHDWWVESLWKTFVDLPSTMNIDASDATGATGSVGSGAGTNAGGFMNAGDSGFASNVGGGTGASLGTGSGSSSGTGWMASGISSGSGTWMGTGTGNSVGTGTWMGNRDSMGTAAGTSMGTASGTSIGTSIETSMGTAIGTSMGTATGTSMGNGDETIFSKPQIEGEMEKTLEVGKGAEVRMICSAYGYPPPSVSWHFLPAGVVSTSEAPLVNHVDGVVTIDAAADDHEGLYVCTATNAAGIATAFRRLKVLSLVQPFVVKPAEVERLRPSLGTTLTLSCRAKFPKTVKDRSIQWELNGRPIAVTEPRIKIRDEEYSNNFGEEVTVISVLSLTMTGKDGGTYSCRAGGSTNDIAIVNEDSSPAAIVAPPRIVNPTTSDHARSTGGVAILECRVMIGGVGGTATDDVITWSRQDGLPLDEKRATSLEDGRMKITNLRRSDKGIYVCQVSNRMGTTSAKRRLFVMAPTLIANAGSSASMTIGGVSSGTNSASMSQTQRLNAGQNLSLKCEVYFDKDSTKKIVIWKKGEVILSRGGRYTISESSIRSPNALDMTKMTSHLLVPAVEVGDAGHYTCNAISDHDQNSASIASVEVFIGRRSTIRIPVLPIEKPSSEPLVTGPKSTIWVPSTTTPFGFPPSVTPPKRVVFMPKGTGGTLSCVATGLPRPSVTWQKTRPVCWSTQTCPFVAAENPVAITSGFGVQVDSAEGNVIFRELEFENSARYQCIASNGRGESKATRELWVYRPTEVLLPTSAKRTTILRGGELHLQCSFKVDSYASFKKIRWFKDGREVVSDGRVSITPATSADVSPRTVELTSSLDSTGVDFADAGSYECRVEVVWENGLFQRERTVGVAVIEVGFSATTSNPGANSPPMIFNMSAITVRVVEGSDATLQCRARGTPMPSVSWEKKDTVGFMVSGRFSKMPTGSLLIRSTQTSDAGSYICYAKNTAGEISALRHLEVYKPTLIVSPAQLQKLNESESTEVICVVKFDVKMKTNEIFWFLNETQMNIDINRMSVSQSPGPTDSVYRLVEYRLRIADLKPTDSGRYSCEARTDLDVIRKLQAVVQVSAQNCKGGNCGMCQYGGANYREGMRFSNKDYSGCYCTCTRVNGVLKVDCDTTQCKPQNCLYDGKSYQVGATFPAKGNCGDCVCKVGQKVACNIPRQCKPTPAPICNGVETFGAIRASGAVWLSPDNCKQYMCDNGKIVAKDQICKCVYNNQNFELGQTFNVECNTCKCKQDGNVQCSQNPCHCTFNNQKLKKGQQVAAPDGCNTCTCGDNMQMSCTNKPCSCFENGVTYAIGQSFNKECNTCQCTQSGQISCTDLACGCYYNGQMVQMGSSITAADGCTRLTCRQNGGNMIPDSSNCVCNYNGMTYQRGQTFNKGDECGNTCTCENNRQVACTNKVCCRNTMNNQIMQIGEFYMKECNRCECQQNGQVNCGNNPCNCFGTAGQKYNIGSSFVHTDGCNTCTCLQNGQIVCGNKKCKCDYNGQLYNIGAQFDKGDGCNKCTCQQSGQVDCTNQICGCQYNGQTINIGTKVNRDECNTCECMQNGQLSCTNNPVPCNCKYGTMTLAIGQSIPKECNTCTCKTNGQVSCTNKPCSCFYNGNVYQIGNSFTQQDGCTRCRCNEDGKVSCSKDLCPIAKPKCDHLGKKYDIGTTWKNECNTCRCQDSMGRAVAACTKKVCGCREPRTGRVYKAGDTWQPDKCTSCTCRQTATSYAPSCKKNPGCKV